ncbi:MAG TPA: hypothetical protein VGH38_38450 [Bryobacteraceae bacterium]
MPAPPQVAHTPVPWHAGHFGSSALKLALLPVPLHREQRPFP